MATMRLEFQKAILFLDQHGIKYTAHARYSNYARLYYIITDNSVEFQFKESDNMIYVSTESRWTAYTNAFSALENALQNGYLKHKKE